MRRADAHYGVAGLLGLGAGILLFVAAQACGGEVPAPEPDRSVPVVFMPRKQAVLTAEVPARLLSVKKEFGDAFAKGETLLVMDAAQYEQNRARAMAQHALAAAHLAAAQRRFEDKTEIRKARAAYGLAEQELKTAEKLYKEKSLSQLELAKARKEMVSAQADLALAESSARPALESAKRDMAAAAANLEQAKRDLDACTVRAPYAGRVVRVLAREHEFLQRGQALIEIVADQVLVAQFLLPSGIYGRVHLKAQLKIKVKETQTTVTATVAHIAATMDPASETFEVRALVDNDERLLRSGMTGTLQLSAIKGE